jgi:excisionase family DNA binding protein
LFRLFRLYLYDQLKLNAMKFIEEIKRPSKLEQKTAMESYDALASMLEELQTENPEIEIEETSEKIRIPLNALKLLVKILEETSKGRLVSIVPIATEMTTQAAAELLGCSRPHLIKLLEKGEIQFTKIGKHRRIRYEDIVKYKKEMKARQKQLLIEIMKSDEESGLYDT